MQKYTLVLGASSNETRYSYKAIKLLTQFHHPILAIGKRAGHIGETPIITEKKAVQHIDTITMYLNAQNQKQYYDYILSIKPKRIIFNPGAENEELEALAKENHIKTMEACTLVLLHTGQY